MSRKTPLTLEPGDFALCYFSGTYERVRITQKKASNGQSRVAYLCEPRPKGSQGWLDAAWFYPVEDK